MPSLLSEIFRSAGGSDRKPDNNNGSDRFDDEEGYLVGQDDDDDEEQYDTYGATGTPTSKNNRDGNQQQQRHRATSSGSTGASPSAFEYSDTSEEFENRRRSDIPSKSSFRMQERMASPSMRVVRFNSSFSEDDYNNIMQDQDLDVGNNMDEGKTNSNPAIPPPPPTSGDFLKKPESSTGSTASATNRQQQSKRKTHRKQHIHPSNANKGPDWMTQLAYSFRSPSPPMTHKHHHHRSQSGSASALMLSSSDQIEYPHQSTSKEDEPARNTSKRIGGKNKIFSKRNDDDTKKRSSNHTNGGKRKDTASKKDTVGVPNKPSLHFNLPPSSTETSPLLGGEFVRGTSDTSSASLPPQPTSPNATRNYVGLAAAFLRDYESGRAPTLSSDLETVTDRQLRLYNYKFGGYSFQVAMAVACVCFFSSSLLEGFEFSSPYYGQYLTCLNCIGLAVLVVDIWFRHELRRNAESPSHTRTSRSQRLMKPVILFSTILAVENIARVTVTPDPTSVVLFSSLFKPLILFYASSKARDALEALRRILRIVLRVLLMELLLILMFAAVASHIFREYATFGDLSTSWLSLFELSTTVVNPSIWMPIYEESRFSAIFFIIFIVIAVFYLHSLVLSVVFSTYIQAAAEIHERSSTDREDAIQMAFVALQQKTKRNLVDISLVRDTLRILRPHYNAMKINALVEIVDPSDQRVVDFGTFRTKIRQALNASIRTARSATTLATLVELVAVCVAVVNFCYVIMVSSKFSASWFDKFQETVGSIITLIAGFELLIRFNPLRIPDFTPLTRLNATFDGIALLAAVTSATGIVFYILEYDDALEFILIGRALDMIRIMRFFQIFRDVVRRSADVMPALRGPIILVLTTMHVFVYLGMALWGGAVQVGKHFGEITYLYDLNNFNSYAEGAVTMFQVLVVNDWHAIAEVFLFADRCSHPVIVNAFFVLANLIGVSIMLNVLTAFFVETFVTKLDDAQSGQAESTTTVQKDRDFTIMATDKPVRRVQSNPSIEEEDKAGKRENEAPIDRGADADSEGSSEDLYEFDVYEREGFDKIMETVSGTAQHNDFAQQMCTYLEIFESLSPGREKVGYLICDQRTLDRFGNRRFQTKAVGFLSEHELNGVVSDMHAELLVLSARATFTNDRALIRTFPHRLDPLRVMEISASVLRRHPAVSLFVLRLLRSPGAKSPPTIPE
mmetsp:Transcript_7744/g.21572  ORF Transcript_7744/g.21572 Transcript_7744/m.21572 type:complete len:1190 (+) Transcript_7744:283-3852(+)